MAFLFVFYLLLVLAVPHDLWDLFKNFFGKFVINVQAVLVPAVIQLYTCVHACSAVFDSL